MMRCGLFFAFSLYNPLLFRWYLAPILPMYVLCILYGGQRILVDPAALLQRVWGEVGHRFLDKVEEV